MPVFALAALLWTLVYLPPLTGLLIVLSLTVLVCYAVARWTWRDEVPLWPATTPPARTQPLVLAHHKKRRRRRRTRRGWLDGVWFVWWT